VGCAVGLSGDYAVLKTPPVIQVDQDMATIIFMRKSNIAGGAVGYYVRENEEKICALESGTYCVYYSKPGEHIFYAETFGGWTPTMKRSEFKITVEAGKSYYVESSIAFKNRPSFDLVSEEDAMGMIPKLQYSEIKR
jgi:hypothetical protein